MRDYFLSLAAEKDVEEVITYIAKENKQAALKFLDELFKTLEMLAKNPEVGHIREDLTDKKVRFWPYKRKYLIIYNEYLPLEIVRMVSGYRDIPVLLKG